MQVLAQLNKLSRGMATRLTSVDVGSPTWTETVPVWREWLDFDIETARMVGWWDDKPLIVTGHDQVKATVFIHDKSGQALIAVANFENESANATLSLADGSEIDNAGARCFAACTLTRHPDGSQGQQVQTTLSARQLWFPVTPDLNLVGMRACRRDPSRVSVHDD